MCVLMYEQPNAATPHPVLQEHLMVAFSVQIAFPSVHRGEATPHRVLFKGAPLWICDREYFFYEFQSGSEQMAKQMYTHTRLDR